MAIASTGYTGTVDYAEWAILASRMGSEYGVIGNDPFLATVGVGDRAVAVSAGEAVGHGIRDVSDATVTLAGSAVTSGDRWDLVALRRDWEAETSTLVLITGGPSKAIPTRNTAPGVTKDDQPLWLVRFTAGQTAAQDFVDLRLWWGDGNAVAKDLLVRNYLTRVGTLVWIKGALHILGFNSSGLPAWSSPSGSPPGTVAAYAGATVPDGWLLCNGSPVDRSTYADLFNAIGTAYGPGNGSSTFNVPNLLGRVPVGRDASQSEFDNLGETGGTKTHTLTVQQMPSHDHDGLLVGSAAVRWGAQFQSGSNKSGIAADGSAVVSTAPAGGGQAHPNLQPYVTVNFIIKT